MRRELESGGYSEERVRERGYCKERVRERGL